TERRLRGGCVVSRPRERPVPSDRGDRRTDRSRHARLARLHAGASDRETDLGRGGLAHRPAPPRAGATDSTERGLISCAPITMCPEALCPPVPASLSHW